MKLKLTMIWIAALAIGLASAYADAPETPQLKTQKDKISYSIGVDIARNFKRLSVGIDMDTLIQGLRTARPIRNCS